MRSSGLSPAISECQRTLICADFYSCGLVAIVFSSTEIDRGHNSGGYEEESRKQSVCKRCKETYAASANSSTSCRFHPSFFVCRRHDDQRRYYELGPDDPPYAAKFYYCCGAENQDAPGCTTSFHISYDN